MVLVTDPHQRAKAAAEELQGEDPVIVKVAALFVAAGLLTPDGAREALDGARDGSPEPSAAGPTAVTEINCTNAGTERRYSPDAAGKRGRFGFAISPRAATGPSVIDGYEDREPSEGGPA